MGEHYTCSGGCNGVSDTPVSCGTEGCSLQGKPLKACICEGGAQAHKSAEGGETNAEHAAHI